MIIYVRTKVGNRVEETLLLNVKNTKHCPDSDTLAKFPLPKNPDAYFRKHESQIILYGGARRMPEQAGILLKGLNIDKLKAKSIVGKSKLLDFSTMPKAAESHPLLTFYLNILSGININLAYAPTVISSPSSAFNMGLADSDNTISLSDVGKLPSTSSCSNIEAYARPSIPAMAIGFPSTEKPYVSFT